MEHVSVMVAMMLALSLVAGIADLRTGLIPNWLTFPALLIGPGVSAALSGKPGLTSSLLGIAIAGGVAWLMYRLGGLGGGDVKLFAALASIGGPRLGLEIELFALCGVLLWGFTKRVYQQPLSASLRACARLVFGPRATREVELTELRLGGAIFAGTLLALLANMSPSW